MSDALSQRKELDAFLSFLATFQLTRPLTTPADLCDGAALFEVLSLVYVSVYVARPRPDLEAACHVAMRTIFDNPHALRRNRRRTGFSGSAP